ncbi:MAG TPA: hypothetical protein VGB15_17030 [Longimicrobium sp.]|jgi:hypothetical protein
MTFRRSLIAAAVAAALPVLSPAPASAQRMSDASADRAVQSRYDAFRDETSVLILSGIPMVGTSRIAETMTWYSYKGRTPPASLDSVVIGLSIKYQHRDRPGEANLQLLENREIIFLLDDSVRFSPAGADYDFKVLPELSASMRFEEGLTMALTVDELRRLANAGSMRLRFGPVETRPVRAGEIQLQAWKAILRRLEPAAAPAPAGG